MCGACGSTVYLDPVMGSEQTLRKRMLVAHTVNSISAGIPGTPRILALTEGWSATGQTGSITLCHTVADIWITVLGRSLLPLAERLEAKAITDEQDALTAQITDVGLRLARQRMLTTLSQLT